MSKTKSFCISKAIVWESYQRVKSNQGGCGDDQCSIADFEKDLKNNLYKIWNRMSSGSYMPPMIRRVDIPKENGGSRSLGIPTVGDRIAQMVVKMYLEPELEGIFHRDSYGYRPKRSAHDALAVPGEILFKRQAAAGTGRRNALPMCSCLSEQGASTLR